MRPIRVYLLIYSDEAGWETDVYRDLDEVFAIWNDAVQKRGRVGFVHVGLSRPPNKAFEQAAASWPERLLLTTSARWVFDALGTYSLRVAEAGGLGLHLALTGWGYVEQPDDGYTGTSRCLGFGVDELVSDALERETVDDSAWLSNLERTKPNIFAEAMTYGVVDEASYQTNEAELSWELKRALGVERLLFLMMGKDENDPIAIARALPPWLLISPISHVKLTVRCANSLNHEGITKISQLKCITITELVGYRNFGRKSQVDLARALWNATLNGPMSTSGEVTSAVALSNEGRRTSSDMGSKKHGSVSPSGTWASFPEAFESTLAQLKNNQQVVLKQRIGLCQSRMTLEEIGEELNLTRERIRQIEGKAIAEFKRNPIWQIEFGKRISMILDGREDPLPLISLGLFDPWFCGIEDMIPAVEFIFKRVLDSRFSALDINGCVFVTDLSEKEWQQSVQHGLNLVEKMAPDKPTKADLRRQIEGLLGIKGREIASELWTLVKNYCLFSNDANGTERLSGTGRGAESLVEVILASSPRPLHYMEIGEQIAERFGRKLDPKRSHSAAANVGILFGRGTYGSARHCPLSLEELEVLRQEAEDIVLSGSPQRQWSCFELVERIGNLALDFEDRIDQYILHFALQKSVVLSNLGRFVWTQSGSRSVGTADRIDVAQAVLVVLEAAGRPLSRDEIKSALARDRGLGGYFQIHPRGSLVKVDEDHWGILERDIHLSPDEIGEVRYRIATALERSQRGLHISEIEGVLSPHLPDLIRTVSPYGILSILQADARFKVSAGNYLFFAEWGEHRRITQGGAVMEVFRKNQNCRLTAREIVGKASEILGRPVDKLSIYGPLREIGARFDDSAGTWSVGFDDSEGDLEAGQDSWLTDLPDNSFEGEGLQKIG